MTILFVMASPEYLRYYDTTIHLLAEKGHKVYLAVNKVSKKKSIQLDSIARMNKNIVIAPLVPRRQDIWYPVARSLRAIVDFVRFLHPDFRNAEALRARIKRKVLPRGFHFLDKIRTLSRSQVRLFLKFLITLERCIPSYGAIEKFIRSIQPDVLLVSPVVDAASDQVDVIKSAKALGVRTGVCIASWDNLTNKGLIRVQPDKVILWNDIQKNEAVEYNAIPPSRIAVTGAQPFDHWFGKQPSKTYKEFCEMVGLRPEKNFLLFVGSSGFISETRREVSFVRRWIEAIRASHDSSIHEAGVLIRPHPYNCGEWELTDMSDLKDVAVYPHTRYNPIEAENRKVFFDSLYYSTAVVGINTSAMIEATIVGKPVLSIVTSDFEKKQEGTLHFHYLLPENGGFLRVASSLEQHIQQLSEAIQKGSKVHKELENFVKSFIRPHGLSTPCTPLVVEVIEHLGKMGRANPEHMSAWLYPLRSFLWLVGLIAASVNKVREKRIRLKKKKRKLKKIKDKENKKSLFAVQSIKKDT